MFNMKQCIKGDKLVTREGVVMIYQGFKTRSTAMNQLVRWPNGQVSCVKEDGFAKFGSAESPDDIVGFDTKVLEIF